MESNKRIFKRGQVWYYKYNDKNRIDDQNEKSSVQKGNRPVVIISNNQNNRCSSTVNIALLTSQDKPNLPVHVDIVNDYGNINTILLEQIYTIPKDDLEDYKFLLSSSDIKKLNDALRVQLDI